MSPRARFHVPEARSPGQELVLAGEEHHHLRNVLRLKAGDRLSVFDGKGRGFAASLVELDRRRAILRVEQEELSTSESPLRVHLAMGLAKGEKLDLAIQKATELGAFAFHPLATGRSDLRLDPERAGARMERWRRVALEACKQSGRTLIPEILPPAKLDEFLARELPNSRVVLDLEGIPASTFFRGGERVCCSSLLAAVGPEGGWSQEELGLLRRNGFVSLCIGPRILRAETAAIVAAGILQLFAGDLGDFTGVFPLPGPNAIKIKA